VRQAPPLLPGKGEDLTGCGSGTGGDLRKKSALVPRLLGRERRPLRGATQIQEDNSSPFSSWYGEAAVGVSAPARPLSFLRCLPKRSQPAALFSAWRHTGYCCGVCAVSWNYILCIFMRKVKI